nr:hypothetical protein [Tanacetum cinerariifolium]
VSTTPEHEGGDYTELLAGANLRTLEAPQSFIISLDSSDPSGVNIAEAEVDFVVRTSVPIITNATTATPTADPAAIAKEKLVSSSVFGSDSSSAGESHPISGGFSDRIVADFLGWHSFTIPIVRKFTIPIVRKLLLLLPLILLLLLKRNLLVLRYLVVILLPRAKVILFLVVFLIVLLPTSLGGIRTIVDPDSNLQRVYVPYWNVTNGFCMDDGGVCREMVDEFTPPPQSFASIRGMKHDQLFTEFNNGAARQISLGAEIRMHAEYNIKEKRRLKSVVEEKDSFLKSSEMEVKVTDLAASVKVREQEVVDLDAMATFVKLQNDSLADQVYKLEASSVGLQEKVTMYENCMSQLKKF